MVGFLRGLGQFGTGAFEGYRTMDDFMAQRQQRELQANAAKAYGEAMMKMSQPQPWRVPMANDYTPPPPAMTLPNFMQAMPKGMDPAAIGMAADRFAPIMRNTQMDEYRDSQIKLGQERNQQAAQRLELGQSRIDARDKQNEIANAFRERALQLQALGLEQRNPMAARAFQATQSKFIRANDRVTSLMRMIGDADRNLAMGVNRDIYDARSMELNAALKAAVTELDNVKAELDQYDPSGMGLPQPTAAPTPKPAAAPTAAPPMAAPAPTAAPAPRPMQPPPKAIEILRSRPDTADKFEKQYNLAPGSAKQYLQAPGPQSGMPVAPGPQGGPLAPWRSPRDAQKFASAERISAEAAADPINQRVAERERLAAAAQAALSEPSVYERPGTLYPTESGGMAPNQPELDASSGFALAPGEQRAPARPAKDFFEDDRLEKSLAQSVMSEAQATKDLAGAATDFVSDVRKNYGQAAGVTPAPRGTAPAKPRPVASSRNPYIGMSDPQLLEAQKRLAARHFAAKTAAERLAISKESQLLMEAAGISGAKRVRNNQGS